MMLRAESPICDMGILPMCGTLSTGKMPVSHLAFLMVVIVGTLLFAQPATQPASAPAYADPKLWARMVEINERGAKIEHLTADFQQEKFTPLLNRPLVSKGTITVSGPRMLWNTSAPEPTVMLIGEREVELYYPKQKVVEIYPMDERLGSLAASPLPRLDVLKRFFTFQEIPAESTADKLALKLTPSDPSLATHLEHVQVLLDVQAGYILRAEMLDADGDRTVIAFSNIETGKQPAGELKIDRPADVKVTRPLDGLQGQSK